MEATVSPTKGNLIASQKSLELARMGYELMDRKRNILVREMMGLIDKANSLRGRIDEIYSVAYRALQIANITLGVCESLAKATPIEDDLSMTFRSVMGVELPTVRMQERPFQPWYDLSSSNAAYDEAYERFHAVKRMLVELAEIESSVYRLAVAIKKTQSRANALQNIIIPGLENTCRFITDALEEKEREEFSRLKVIKANKTREQTDD